MHRAACATKAPGAPIIPPPPLTAKQARTTPVDNGRGESADKTLGLGLEGGQEGRAQVPRLSVERRPLRAGALQRRSGPPDDRAVRLGFGHIPGDHRSAGLRADLRQPDPRHSAGASPRDGDPLVADRVGDPDVLRASRPADAPCLGHQPRQLPNRRRHPALLHRLRHDFRAAHRAPRKARRGDRRHARGRGHQRLPDGDPDDHRPGLDRQRDAVGVAARRTSLQSRSCWRRSPR